MRFVPSVAVDEVMSYDGDAPGMALTGQVRPLTA
jgi:hypothetical protein